MKMVCGSASLRKQTERDFMSFLNRSISGVCLAWLALGWMRSRRRSHAAARHAPASTQPASAVRGTVTAEGDVPLAEMVVYLESAEPAWKAPQAIGGRKGFAEVQPRRGW